MNSLRFVALFALLTLIFPSCTSFSNDKKPTEKNQIENLPATESDYGKSEKTDTSIGIPNEQADAHSTDWDKKIIKKAELNIEVKDYNKFNYRLHETVKKFGGYIAQEEQNQTDEKIQNTILIKVPVALFDDAVVQLSSPDEKIIVKKISSEDLSTEFIDIKSRIEAKKEVRARYLDLLKEARNMKDILVVQKEINEIQEDLESADGRVAYLSHSAAYSNIQLDFYQTLNSTPAEKKEPGFFQKIKESFLTGFIWSSSLLIGLVRIWPLLLIGIGLILFYKRGRKTSGNLHSGN